MKSPLHFLYIYLTDECNLKCIHCWQSASASGTRKYASLRFDECKRFLDDVLTMGLKSITFSGGEPLLNPEFQEFAEYFHKNRIEMSMETNGMLLSDRKISDIIRDCKVYCAISLDGLHPETHNKHRGNPNAFKRTVESIKKLEQERIYYQLIIAVSKFNYHELIPLFDFVKEHWKYCNSFKINIVTALGRGKGMAKKGLLFKSEELPEITEDIAPLVGKYPFKILLHIDPAFFSFKNYLLKYSCGGNCGYKNALSILAGGDVSICSLGKQVDGYTFGHVSAVDIKDVWENNPFLKEIHEDVHTKLKGICANCIFRKRCVGGCRAKALCDYGDFFAPQPHCQAYYDSGKFPESKLRHHNFLA